MQTQSAYHGAAIPSLQPQSALKNQTRATKQASQTPLLTYALWYLLLPPTPKILGQGRATVSSYEQAACDCPHAHTRTHGLTDPRSEEDTDPDACREE